MDKKSFVSIVLAALVLAIIYYGMQQSSLGQHGNSLSEWAPVENAIGTNGTLSPYGSLFMISFLRTDLNVTIESIRLNPAMGLDSWVAFQRMGDSAMLMGDLRSPERKSGR